MYKPIDTDQFRGTPLGRYGYGSVLFWIVFTFVLGIIFAAFSWGFAYFLLFWILWLIYYSMLINFQYPVWRLFTIIGIFCTGLIGFLLGRFLVGDEDPFRPYYED